MLLKVLPTDQSALSVHARAQAEDQGPTLQQIGWHGCLMEDGAAVAERES